MLNFSYVDNDDVNFDKSSLKEIEEKCESESESASASTSTKDIVAASSSSSFKFGIFDLVAQIDPHCHPQQWCGFLRKLTKGPSSSLLAFNPCLPSLPSIKSKKKSRKHTQSMPEIPSTFDPKLYCFEASWIVYSLNELKDATDNFSHGL